ncbi:MAG: hypothetical protein ACREXX_00815 [Gammaproteobacteria bacterium]
MPDCKRGMPAQLVVAGTLGELLLDQMTDEFFSDVVSNDSARTLREGVNMRGKAASHRNFRWVMGGRELYVLAAGDDYGLGGWVSVPRLLLGEKHQVLATTAYEDEVWKSLESAGCDPPEVWDDSVPGVPKGWRLFRDVTPTRAVPARDEEDVMNALCPLADVAPHLTGGIRLEGRTWLLGYPPRVRFTGEPGDDFRVMIDGQDAQLADNGAFEVPGWDSVGEHRLWFGGQSVTYTLRTMEESWDRWAAHDFGTGAAICGASTYPVDNQRWHQVRVTRTNPWILGSRPGELYRCCAPRDVRCDTFVALVPFAPVWALPADPIHSNKHSARVLLLQPAEPVYFAETKIGNRAARRAVGAWIAVINDAGRKHLQVDPDGTNSSALWRDYRAVAKQLWRRLR